MLTAYEMRKQSAGGGRRHGYNDQQCSNGTSVCRAYWPSFTKPSTRISKHLYDYFTDECRILTNDEINSYKALCSLFVGQEQALGGSSRKP
jgi:hypothetical protein